MGILRKSSKLCNIPTNSSNGSNSTNARVVNWSDAVQRIPERGHSLLTRTDLERGRPRARSRPIHGDAEEMNTHTHPNLNESIGGSRSEVVCEGEGKSVREKETRGQRRDKRHSNAAVCCRYLVLALLQMAVTVSAAFSLVAIQRLVSSRSNAFEIGRQSVALSQSSIPSEVVGTLITAASSAGMMLALALPYAVMFVYSLPKLFQENQTGVFLMSGAILTVVLAILQSIGHCLFAFHVLYMINNSMLGLLLLPGFCLPGCVLRLLTSRNVRSIIPNIMAVVMVTGGIVAILLLIQEPHLYWMVPLSILLSGTADAHSIATPNRLWASKPPRRYLIACISHVLCIITVCAGCAISDMILKGNAWRGFAWTFTHGLPFLLKMPALFQPVICHIITGFSMFLFSWLACAVQGQRVAAVIPLVLSLPLSHGVLYLVQQNLLPTWLTSLSNLTELERDIPGPNMFIYIGIGVCMWLGFVLHIRNTWYQDYMWVPLEHNLWYYPRYTTLSGPVSVLGNLIARKLSQKDVRIADTGDISDDDDIDYETTTHINPLEPIPMPKEESIRAIPIGVGSAGAMIYMCSTLWHETRVEMSTLLNSLLTVDMEKNSKFIKLETHIFFDNAYDDSNGEVSTGEIGFNSFAEIFQELIPHFVDESRHTRVTETPYGHRMKCIFPNGTPLFIHFKDARLVANKKRWSQVQYMFYILHYRCSPTRYGKQSYKNTFILTTDGDVGFDYTSLEDLLLYLLRDETVGAVCARIHPIGKTPVAWFQIFEYSIGHWLMKTFESVMGSVLCCPGAFSLFRAEAMADVTHLYSAHATTATEYLMYDQGEDRWLSTLLLKTGWILQYCASAEATTQCPETFPELFNQRRRWLTSTIANLNDLLILNAPNLIKANTGVSWLYVIYQVVLLFCSLLSPGICLLVIAGGLNVTFGWSSLWMTVLGSIITLAFCILCVKGEKQTQIRVAMVLAVVFALAMTAVLVGLCVIVVEDITDPNSIFICFISSLIVSTALLHPSECWSLVHSFVFFLAIPTSYVFMVIYAIANLNVTSWGTRETVTESVPTDPSPIVPLSSTHGNTTTYKHVNIGPIRMTYGSWHLGFAHKTNAHYRHLESIDERDEAMHSSGMHMPPITEDEEEVHFDQTHATQVLYNDSNNSSIYVDDVKNTIAEEHGHMTVSETSGVLGEKTAPFIRDVDDEYDNSSRVSSLFSSCSAVSKRITDEEREFWNAVVARYLSPENEAMDDTDLQSELTNMRNNAMYGMVLLNVIWLVAVTALSYQEHLQVVDTNVLGLVFLTLFSGLLVVQFVAMAYHRIGTAIHILAQAKTHSGAMRIHKVKTNKRKNDMNVGNVALSDLQDVQEVEMIDHSHTRSSTPSQPENVSEGEM
eukprot:CFRG4774T1